MKIDLDINEVQVLVYAIAMYQNHIKKEMQELKELVKERKNEWGCCIDAGPKVEKEAPSYNNVKYIAKLKEKLRKQQMLFPLDEH